MCYFQVNDVNACLWLHWQGWLTPKQPGFKYAWLPCLGWILKKYKCLNPQPKNISELKHYWKYETNCHKMRSRSWSPAFASICMFASTLAADTVNIHCIGLPFNQWYLPLLKKEVMFLVRSVCLFVCLSVGLLVNLWTDYDEIFWRGRAWLKDQVIQFWWRSGSRFRSGSPKSEIQILRIGGGLCSLSIAFLFLCVMTGDFSAFQTCCSSKFACKLVLMWFFVCALEKIVFYV